MKVVHPNTDVQTEPDNDTKAVRHRLNVDAIRKDFPIFSRRINDKPLTYLDSAATTQKPQIVIDALVSYYKNHNANVHRGLHTLAEEATSAYEAVRDKVAMFVGGVKREEIVFTRNTTESINMVAQSWGRKNIKRGDRIVLTQMEHHANLVPWLILSQDTGAELEYIKIDKDGYLDLSNIDDIINSKTKIVAVTQMSNVLGTINPVEEIIEIAHKRGAVALVDGAQSTPHMPVDIVKMNPDFYAFSAHKMLGPTGVGVLYAKEEHFKNMTPVQFGGEMIGEVRYDYVDWAELPWKFEAGTPNIADVIAFGPALDYLKNIGMDNIRTHEMDLTEYALNRLAELDYLKIFGPHDVRYRGGAVSFVDPEIHPHDLAQSLDSQGIAVRAGHHCAEPLTKLLGVFATVRASMYIYNNHEDIDRLIAGLREARRYFLK
jgi:cysteine desulfurase / selenocysteine lyase